MREIQELNIVWEEIYNNSSEHEQEWFESTYRAEVIGGWLVRHEVCYDYNYHNKAGSEGWDRRQHSMVFIPDNKHQWDRERDVMAGVL